MYTLLHNLTMFVVLCHALVGCCWHHAHADLETAEVASESPGCAGQECGGHGHDRGPAGCPGDHGETCDGQQCFFVVPSPDRTADSIDDPGLAELVSSDRVTPSFLLQGNLLQEAPPPVGILPLRLHLVIQVLLV